MVFLKIVGIQSKRLYYKIAKRTEITLIIRDIERYPLNSWSSCKGRKGNALALRADEGRDKLRKATGSRKWALIRGYPNGETRQSNTLSAITESIGYGGEPPELKHLSRARKRNQPRFR